MTFAELLIIAIGVSMDAFAVSISKGLSSPRLKVGNAAVTGAWFGGFQPDCEKWAPAVFGSADFRL
mgnify:CR=1 FL=1